MRRSAMTYVDYAKLNGVVFDISLTPNRGDATGVAGIARDLAAFGLGTLTTPPVEPVPATAGPSPIPRRAALRRGRAARPAACSRAG